MTSNHELAVENAWHIHAQLTDWTGKVDLKARFGLSFVSAVIAGLLAIYGDGTRVYGGTTQLTDFSGLETAFFIVGVMLIIEAFLVSVLAVTPQLWARRSKREYKSGIIYFGHLRHWNSYDLTLKLRDVDMLPVLSSQLINMSKILWRKHRTIELLFGSAVLGITLIGVAELMAYCVEP